MTSPVSAIEAIAKAMEGVTPGRWGQYHPSYAPEAEGAPFSTWDSSHDVSAMEDGKLIKRIATFKHATDAAYLDACSPDRMREVLALARQAEALQRENAELREALRPFGAFAEKAERFVQGRADFGGEPVMPTKHFRLADFRRARALLVG